MKPPALPQSPQDVAQKAHEKKREAFSRLLDTACTYASFVREGGHPARRPASTTLTRVAISILLNELEDATWRPLLEELITPERAQQLRVDRTDSDPEESLSTLLNRLIAADLAAQAAGGMARRDTRLAQEEKPPVAEREILRA